MTSVPSTSSTKTFEDLESNVRGYCRSFPTVFKSAKGSMLRDEGGREYIDFFAGAGALNYGHNPGVVQDKLVEYLRSDGVIHSLDMYTVAKRAFLDRFRETILRPRNLDHKVQFCGPTGTNGVEAALKLARLATGRTTVCAFSGGWHGMSAGALTVCAKNEDRALIGLPYPGAAFLPFPVGPYKHPDPLGHVEAMFSDPNSGLDLPAAVILETTQAEGGVYSAPDAWLRGLRALCDKFGVLLIVDDIQVGCGRTGGFFSFERAGIVPDIVLLSKSIGGAGLPMSLLLMRPHLDVWKPGQHTGTFRGHQLSFVAATAVLDHWAGEGLRPSVTAKGALVEKLLSGGLLPLDPRIELRGIGLIRGIDFTAARGGAETAGRISKRCFEKGLIVERCGRNDTVIKLLPPLVTDDELLTRGCGILVEAAREVYAQ